MEQSLSPSIPLSSISIPSIPLSSTSNPLYSPTNQRAFRLLSEPDLRVSREFPFSPGSPSPSSSFSPNYSSSSPLPSSPSSHSPFSPNYYRSSPPLAFLNKYRQIVDAQGLLPETALFHRFLRSVKRLTKPSNEGRGRSGSESDRERDREKEGRGRMVCFMSYAWMPDKQDNDALQAKLVKIKGDLMIAGVKVMLDIHNMMGEIDKYMINGIKSSGKLLLICTPRLKERADEHGYGLNNLQIELEEALAKQKIDHNFIIPLILNGHRESSIASRLPNILSLDLSDPKEYYSRMTSLSPMGLLPMILELHDNPLYSDLLSGYHAQVDLLHKELSASLAHSLESLDSEVLTDPLDVNHLAMIHRKIESHIDEIQKENQQLQAKAREGEIMREEVKELKHRLQVSGGWTPKEGENEITKKEGLEKRIQGLEAEVERLNKEKGELQAAKLELEKRNIELTSKIEGKNTSGEKIHKSAELARTSGEFEAFVRDTLGDSRELQILYKTSLLEITTLKERIASLQTNHENEIQQTKDKTNTETLALQKRISELQLERRDFQAKLDDSANQQQLLASEQKRLLSEISKMKEEFQRAQDKKETLISFQDMDGSEVNELRKKNEQLQESIRESQKLHETEINDLKKKNNEVVNWTLVIQKQMQQKEGQHKSEVENLKKQIKEFNNESETKRRQIMELQSTQTETQKELTMKLKEIADFREEKIIMTKELLAMRENNENLKGMNVALQKQVSDGKQLAKWFSLDGGNLL